MAEVRNLTDLEKIADSKTIDNIFAEYFLLLKGKATVLDKIVVALDDNKTTVDDIKQIIVGTDESDFMV